MIYTGIGSRKTPPGILAQMSELAAFLARSGWVLRSGGAPGADFPETCSFPVCP